MRARRRPRREERARGAYEHVPELRLAWLPRRCARCLCLLDEIRAEGLPVPADANNAVMRACASRIDVVQALFDSLAVEGTETEASFAALMNARLECGDLEGATAALDGLLAKPRLRPKLRTCSPLLTHLCEVGDARATIDLWERLSRRGLEFTQREYSARLGLHSRVGEAVELQHTLIDLLKRWPTPDAASVAAIQAAVEHFGSRGGDGSGEGAATVTVRRGVHDGGGRCSCCGERLP